MVSAIQNVLFRILHILSLPYFALALFAFLVGTFSQDSFAQNRTIELFREDIEKNADDLARKKQRVLKAYDKQASDDLKIRGENISFSKSGNTLQLRDRVIASTQNFSIQAGGAEVDVEKQQGTFSGDVVLSHPEFSVSCSEAYLDLPYELGVFKDASFRIEEVEFLAQAESIIKYSEFSYRLYDSTISTCDTDLNPLPWEIFSDSLDITQEGYAHASWAGLSFYGVPVLYSPYLGFPVKQEKSSGLLAPSIGYNSQNGLQLWMPFHIVLDDATDITVSPMLETNTRYGAELEFRKAFSLDHSLESRWIYSDEGARGDDLRGLQAREDGILPFEKERFGGFFNQSWRTDSESPIVASFLADIHYVNDDLLLRELEDPDIGLRNANFLSSRVVSQLGLGSWGTAELFGEYNQSIDSNFDSTDDSMLQRLPEANVRLFQTFRPFGFNPYGLKLATKANLGVTQFDREVGVKGRRLNVNPQVSVPFHYKNFLSGGMGLSYLDTSYDLESFDALDENGESLGDSPSRQTYIFSANLNTVVERIFEIPDDSFLTTVTGLGLASAQDELKRVKHEVEPFVRYNFVPDVDQERLPLFDSFDRIRHRSLVTYGITNRFVGKRESTKSFRSPIEELTPRMDSLPGLDASDAVVNLDYARQALAGGGRVVGSRSGQVTSLAQFSILQSYDLVEASDDVDPIREALSDVNFVLTLSPNAMFNWTVNANFSPDRTELTSWNTGLFLQDDRGDSLSANYSLVSPQVLNADGNVVDGTDISNIDGQLELAITDRLKLGYFARYDGTAGEFIDQILGLRIANECNCWTVDVGFSDRTNPDRQQFLLKFNLSGLGRVQQSVLYSSIRESLRYLP